MKIFLVLLSFCLTIRCNYFTFSFSC